MEIKYLFLYIISVGNSSINDYLILLVPIIFSFYKIFTKPNKSNQINYYEKNKENDFTEAYFFDASNNKTLKRKSIDKDNILYINHLTKDLPLETYKGLIENNLINYINIIKEINIQKINNKSNKIIIEKIQITYKELHEFIFILKFLYELVKNNQELIIEKLCIDLFENENIFDYIKYVEETKNLKNLCFNPEKLHRNNEYYIHIINSCEKILDFNYFNKVIQNICILNFKSKENPDKDTLLEIFNNKIPKVQVNLINI